LLANSARTELFFEERLALARRSTWPGLPATKHAVMRQAIAWLKIETEIAKRLFYRHLTTELRGAIPGPEASMANAPWTCPDKPRAHPGERFLQCSTAGQVPPPAVIPYPCVYVFLPSMIVTLARNIYDIYIK
jgi:hypothetical protein